MVVACCPALDPRRAWTGDGLVAGHEGDVARGHAQPDPDDSRSVGYIREQVAAGREF